ncbi:DUF2189 domain-containing protein [Pseudaminobacter sp. NGMCC 1.201702]|uniref:DUF2189 domain-containing protein n=1 Tax=Pseudaminobacter sp. NGMCC 1.201702 TaxID=3391825 RepID=UPI0039EF8B09
MGDVDLAEMHAPTLGESRNRGLPPAASLDWLRAGWRDLAVHPGASLAYGLVVFAVSLGVISGLIFLGLDYILFPAIAAFMVVGPLVAVGLYEKSRLIEAGGKVTLGRMVFVRPASGAQVLFTGVILCGLALLWMRAAVILYALFFGLLPFPGLDHIAEMLFTTGIGWAMLVTGTIVGGLFAAFSFAISAFAVPMLLAERTDAFTAMGTSISLVWNNLPVMIAWGSIVLVLTVLGLVTGIAGLIVVFPLLGHASWHAYKAIR